MIQPLITLGGERREVPIEKPALTIGRLRENAVPLPDNRLSRRHARFGQDELGFLVKDLNSAKGTRLNRRRVTSDRLLQGDELRVGRASILILSLRNC
ncbi:MAG TPA: FHA domain-containing protein [Planctomycetota bacterium]|nr:FHA domain-containing protein [Planctomycetota bacterium]